MFSTYRVEVLRVDGWHVQRHLSPSRAASALRTAHGHPLTLRTRCLPDIVLQRPFQRCGGCHGEGINRGSYNDCEECGGIGRVPHDHEYGRHPCSTF